MAASPEYTSRPINADVLISTANANRDGTGTLGTAYTFTAGGRGGRIDAVTIQAIGTTTAGMVRMFINGVLRREWLVAALTPSATVKAFTVQAADGADANGRVAMGIVCKPGDVVAFSTHNAESFQCVVEGGEF